MTLRIVGDPETGITEQEIFDRLKGRKFVAVYIDENDNYKYSQSKVDDREMCYMASLLINRLFQE